MVPNTRDSIESTLSENGAKIQQAARDTEPRTVSDGTKSEKLG